MTQQEITESALGTIAACRTLAELDSAIALMCYDTTDWSGETVATITDAYEARKAALATVEIEEAYIARKRAEIVARAPRGPRPITDEMVTASRALRNVALAYVRTYKGFNSFVQDLAVRLADYGSLTIPQMRGALNVMIAADRAKAPLRDTSEVKAPGAFYVDLSTSAMPDPLEHMTASTAPIARCVPNGTYTVQINADGEYRVLRLSDCSDKFDQPVGTQILAYQSGASNEIDFTGFAFVRGERLFVWKRFRSAQDLSFAAVKLLTTGRAAEFGKLWAMASGRCYICGRTLTVPISKRAGIGPICAANNGIDIHALAALGKRSDDRISRLAQADIDELFPE